MAFHYMPDMPPGSRGDGKHLKSWACMTIFLAMNVKAQRVGKSPLSTDAYDLMGILAGEEAERLYGDLKKRNEVVDTYFETVLVWCQNHIAKIS